MFRVCSKSLFLVSSSEKDDRMRAETPASVSTPFIVVRDNRSLETLFALMTILSQSFLTFVRRNLVSFLFLTVWHSFLILESL